MAIADPLQMACTIPHDVFKLILSFKDPRTAAPEEFWNGLEEDCSIFTTAVDKIVNACKNGIPSFAELLRVFCGGSLRQKCTFCRKSMMVEAICGDVKGSKFRTPEVVLRPYIARWTLLMDRNHSIV